MRITKTVSLLSLFLFIITFAQPLPAQSPQVSAREIFSIHKENVRLHTVSWSPNDKFIAFDETNEGIAYLNLLDVDKKTSITFGSEKLLNATVFLDWNYDSSLLASSYNVSVGLIHIWDISNPTNPHLSLELVHKPYEDKYSQITSLELHPSKNQLMTVGGTSVDYQADEDETRTVDIWDIESGELIHEIANEDEYVLGAYWSPNGNFIALSYQSEAIDLYSATDFKFLERIRSERTDRNGDDPISFLRSWNLDSTKIVGSNCQWANYSLWSLNIADSSMLTFVKNSTNDSPCLAHLEWNPQYDILASVGFIENEIKLWNGLDGTELLAIEVAQGWAGEFSWNSTGDNLVSITQDGDIQIWEILYEP